MRLDLKNIGIIKEASVKLDGLTVIAGENDTGKSTLGRAYYYEVKKSLEQKVIEDTTTNNQNVNQEAILIGALLGFGIGLLTSRPVAGAAIGGLLGAGVSDIKESSSITNSRSMFDENISLKLDKNEILVNAIMIETPYSLNTASYIKTTQILASQRGLT
jgi:predicted ATPase